MSNISISSLKKLGIDPKILRKSHVSTLDELLKDPPLMILSQVLHNAVLNVGGYQLNLKKKSVLAMPLGFFIDAKRDKNPGSRRKNFKEYRRPFTSFFNRYRGQNLNDKTLLIWRTGGIGDIIFTQPIVKYLKKTYSNCKILFATAPRFVPILFDWPNGLIDGAIMIPYSIKYLHESNYQLSFEGVIERCDESNYVNCYDLFSKTAGLDIDHSNKEFQPELIVNPTAMEEIEKNEKIKIPENFVVAQMRASNPIRMMSEEKWAGIIKRINELGKNVVFVDAPNISRVYDNFIDKYKLDKTKVFNLSELSKTINYAIAIISKSDGVIGIDSSFVHIGNALNKPVLGIYGSFKGELRMKYYKNAEWVESEKVCERQPCFLHQVNAYENCSYIKERKAPICLDKINDDEIIEKFKKLFIK